MEKTDIISQLISLREDLESQLREKDAFNKARLIRQSIRYSFRTKLDLFDEAHKADYILSVVGAKPEKPKGIIKITIPVYKAKKAQYENAIIEYQKQCKLAEKAYYYDYKSQREKLEKTADQEIKEAVDAAEAEYQRADQALRTITDRIGSNAIVGSKYKTIEIVSMLIEFLQDGRADTVKEAINLWHDEESKKIEMEKAEAHRAEMLRLEQERLEAAQEAADYQRMAYYAAQDAAESAKEAADDARRAAQDVQYAVWSEHYDD